MIQKLKNFIKTAMVTTLFVVPVAAPVAVGAAPDIQEGLCKGANLNVSSGGSCATDGDAENKVNGLIKLIIDIFSIIVGVVAVIMIIIGGLKYITSSGDSTNVQSAKNTILYAIIGLIVVALAQIIVKFVLSKAINADGTT